MYWFGNLALKMIVWIMINISCLLLDALNILSMVNTCVLMYRGMHNAFATGASALTVTILVSLLSCVFSN